MKKLALLAITFLQLSLITPLFSHAIVNAAETEEKTSQASTEQTMQPNVSGNDGFTIIPANPKNPKDPKNARKFIYELKPGEKIEDYAYVKNLSSEPSTFLLYGADPTVSSQGSLAYMTRANNGNGPGKWFQFEKSEITLAPQEIQKVKFTVQVPQETALGDYKAGVAMEKSKKDTNNPNITIATRIILHSELKITNTPGAGSTNTKALTTNEIQWQNYYFWISLGLFIISLILLIWTTLKEKYSLEKNLNETKKPSTSKAPPVKKSLKSKTKKPTSKKK